MGLTISSLFSRLFGKKQMRILMGESGAEGRGQALVGWPGLFAWSGLGACFFTPRQLWWGRGGGLGVGGILKGEQWGEGWAVARDLSKRLERGRGQGFLLLGLAFSSWSY